MAEKKEYTAQEVAEAILKKCEELYKSSTLAKAVNSAHEIEAGSEPSNADAEAPEQLTAGSVSQEGGESEDSEKKKKKEDESEDESEEVESEESEDESEDESEEDDKEEKKPFEKSEDLDKCGDMKKEEGMGVDEAVSAIMSDSHGVNDVMDKVHSSKRGKVLAALRGKDAKKAEMCKAYMAKCGDMVQAKMDKSEKLRNFIQKRKNK